MRELFAVACKDVRLLLRDRPGFFFTFVWPVIMAMFFGSIFSGAGRGANQLGIVVVDEDRSAGSAALVERLEQREELRVERQLMRETAVNLVRRGRVAAAVILPAGYGDATQNLFAGQTPRVVLAIDPARRAESGLLSGVLFQLAAEGVREVLEQPDQMRQQVEESRQALAGAGESLQPLDAFLASLENLLGADGGLFPGGAGGGGFFEPLAVDELRVEPLARDDRPANPFAISFPQGMIWGLLGCTAAFAVSFVTERTRGTLLRLHVSALAPWQILGGKALACFLTAQLLVATIVTLGVIVFGVRPQSIPLLAVAMFCAGFCFVGLMMLLSVLGRTEQAAIGIAWATLLLLAMIGGGMIPLFIMPAWMRTLSHASPVKWAVLAFEGAIWRGFSPAEMLLPCAILVATGAVCLGLGLRAYRGS